MQWGLTYPIEFNNGDLLNPVEFSNGDLVNPVEFSNGDLLNPVEFNNGDLLNPVEFSNGDLLNPVEFSNGVSKGDLHMRNFTNFLALNARLHFSVDRIAPGPHSLKQQNLLIRILIMVFNIIYEWQNNKKSTLFNYYLGFKGRLE